MLSVASGVHIVQGDQNFWLQQNQVPLAFLEENSVSPAAP